MSEDGDAKEILEGNNIWYALGVIAIFFVISILAYGYIQNILAGIFLAILGFGLTFSSIQRFRRDKLSKKFLENDIGNSPYLNNLAVFLSGVMLLLLGLGLCYVSNS